MLELIDQYYNDFLLFSKSNQVVAGMLGLWGLTVLTFILKTVPSKIFSFVYKQCTTNLVLNSYDYIYHDFLQWVSENKMHSFVRNINFNNKGVYSTGIPMVSIGYGNTMFIYNRRIFIMSRQKEEANQTNLGKETIKLTLLGRSHSVFVSLFQTIATANEEENHLIRIHTWNESYWDRTCTQHKRTFETVVIEEEKKKEICDFVESFIEDKEWYRENGFPYLTGIFFDGPPGGGKTSLIKAICSEYNLDMYTINMATMSDTTLSKAMSCLPFNCVLAIEDIDTANIGKRSLPDYTYNKSGNDSHKKLSEVKYHPDGTTLLKPADSEEDKFGVLSLGGILNAVDGATTTEGRILIATANDISKLDDALLRDGRFDLKMTIGYMNNVTMTKYLSRFYPDYDFSSWDIKDGVAPSSVQKLVKKYRNEPEMVLSEIAERRLNNDEEA